MAWDGLPARRRTTTYAQQGFAGDGEQRPLVPRSRSSPRLKPGVRPTAGGRANGVAGEPHWLRPPTAAEPADGTDGPAGHGSPATPLGAQVTVKGGN